MAKKPPGLGKGQTTGFLHEPSPFAGELAAALERAAAREGAPPEMRDPGISNFWKNLDSNRIAALADGLGVPARLDWSRVPTLSEANNYIRKRNIRRRMKALGFEADRQLSMAAGLSESALRHVLSGRSQEGRAGTMQKIAAALKCSQDDLTGARYFEPFGAEDEAIFRRALGRFFMDADTLRNEATESKDPRKSQEKRALANRIDFIDGPYEWQHEAPAATPAARPTARLAPEMPPGAFSLTPAQIAERLADRVTAPVKDLPLYAAARGGPEGSMVLDFNPIEMLERPTALIGVRDAFALVIVDESMEPRYEHGEAVLVRPHLKPTSGTDMVFVQKTPDGATYMLVKRLISFNDSEWRVLQYNPEKKFSLKRSEWQQAFVITGRLDRR
ncbi:MAG: S24 family peptidase [Rhodospirillaceae bacterium]